MTLETSQIQVPGGGIGTWLTKKFWGGPKDQEGRPESPTDPREPRISVLGRNTIDQSWVKEKAH